MNGQLHWTNKEGKIVPLRKRLEEEKEIEGVGPIRALKSCEAEIEAFKKYVKKLELEIIRLQRERSQWKV